jgi:hypothetical protein
LWRFSGVSWRLVFLVVSEAQGVFCRSNGRVLPYNWTFEYYAVSRIERQPMTKDDAIKAIEAVQSHYPHGNMKYGDMVKSECLSAIRALPDAGCSEAMRRFDYASKQYHNTQDWYGEDSPEEGKSLHDWFMESLAAPTPSQDQSKAEEALEFYAKYVAECVMLGKVGDHARHVLHSDGGVRARVALGDKS